MPLLPFDHHLICSCRDSVIKTEVVEKKIISKSAVASKTKLRRWHDGLIVRHAQNQYI